MRTRDKRNTMGDYALSPSGSGQSALSRSCRSTAAIAPSHRFVSLTRNPSLEPPSRFEPTVKAEGDIVL